MVYLFRTNVIFSSINCSLILISLLHVTEFNIRKSHVCDMIKLSDLKSVINIIYNQFLKYTTFFETYYFFSETKLVQKILTILANS